MMPGDTIFALSSGSGRSGVAVVRVSGPMAGAVIDQFASPRPAPRRFVRRDLLASDQDVIDQGIVVWLPGPATVTGEDMAEFHVHGSPAVVGKLLHELSSIDGCRLALAGEFSRRAFENGKLDLVEVEGLADLLAADTEAQRRLAMRQYLGDASDVYETWRLQVLECLAFVEAAIDFADEDGVAAQSLAEIRPRLCGLIASLRSAQDRSAAASAARRGLSVVIGGAPNAGKSSLINALAGRLVSIVSAVPGTTRDVVADVVVIADVPVRLVDTAGLRAGTNDEIEVEGIRRAEEALSSADVLVWLRAIDDDLKVIPPRRPDISVVSKIDLANDFSIRIRDDEGTGVSTMTGEGVAALREALDRLIRTRLASAEDGTMVRARHTHAVNKALTHLSSALAHDEAALELLAEDVRKAAVALASITGRVDVEDVLGQIFSEFCIGK